MTTTVLATERLFVNKCAVPGMTDGRADDERTYRDWLERVSVDGWSEGGATG